MVATDAADGNGNGIGEASASKPKRVRTGCLTCRERHLKCDEAMPDCNNCRKSNRTCKRGVRLNFIDTWVQSPPAIPAAQMGRERNVGFRDESREIASEYQGGLAKYRHLSRELEPPLHPDNSMAFDFATTAQQAPSIAQQALPPIQGILPESFSSHAQQEDINNMFAQQPKQDSGHSQNTGNHGLHSGGSTNASLFNGSTGLTAQGSISSYTTTEQTLDPEDEKKEYLDSQEEVLFMQVFVEEVGLWMDSMDSMKHFSRLLPFHSLQAPMLLNAFLACGARHLTLVNPAYTEDKALHYYDTSTRHLLKNLQNPNRDTAICATTAVVLNVYEIMSERPLQRMNHIAGARALIKECGWNARAQGIGAACFWLNVGLEVLSCFRFNWQVAWDPDDWGCDMDFTRELHNGREEVWAHRMLYIAAKVCNFRATIPRFQDSDSREEQVRKHARYEEWQRLKSWADAWNENIPRTMHPMAYLYPYQTTSKSAFPEVWLVKRSTIVARLYYHTVMLMMAQVHPYWDTNQDQMAEMQDRHAQMICGIAAHIKDRGVASVAIHSLAHAAELLTSRREQEEVLQIFEKINKETGWRIGFVFKELKEKWGWLDDQQPPHHTHSQQAIMQSSNLQGPLSMQANTDFSYQTNVQQQQPQLSMTSAIPPAPPPQPMQPLPHQHSAPAAANRKPPAGISNPMYAKADFNLPQHPYQNFYVAPSIAPNAAQQAQMLYY